MEPASSRSHGTARQVTGSESRTDALHFVQQGLKTSKPSQPEYPRKRNSPCAKHSRIALDQRAILPDCGPRIYEYDRRHACVTSATMARLLIFQWNGRSESDIWYRGALAWVSDSASCLWRCKSLGVNSCSERRPNRLHIT